MSLDEHGPDYCACFEGTYRNGHDCDVLGPKCPKLKDEKCEPLCGEGLVVGKDGYQCMETCVGQYKYWLQEKINGDWYCKLNYTPYIVHAALWALAIPPSIGLIG